MLPLQLIDSFLLDYNVGQALLLAFVLTTLALLPLKSLKAIALNLVVFGIVFLATPQQLVPIHYLFLGVTLVVVGPMLFVMGD
jgi:hypothetical protein